MYSSGLDNIGGGLGAAPASLGLGKPPQLPGALPPPTNVGAMPTGNPSTTKKAAADQAILALRDCKGYAPELAPQIDAMIDALKASAQSGTPKGGTGQPAPPGGANTDGSLMESGSPGD